MMEWTWQNKRRKRTGQVPADLRLRHSALAPPPPLFPSRRLFTFSRLLYFLLHSEGIVGLPSRPQYSVSRIDVRMPHDSVATRDLTVPPNMACANKYLFDVSTHYHFVYLASLLKLFSL